MDHMEGIFRGNEKIKEMLENVRETPRRYGPCSTRYECVPSDVRREDLIMQNRAPSGSLVNEQESPAPVINRREEARIEDCHSCSYEIVAPGEPGAAGVQPGVQQGQVFTLNRSAHGMLLLMGQPPRPNQRIEVHSARLGWWRSTMVYDVRWTRPIQIGPQGDLFLVGCRLTTGLPL
jgi:hypothetical protein